MRQLSSRSFRSPPSSNRATRPEARPRGFPRSRPSVARHTHTSHTSHTYTRHTHTSHITHAVSVRSTATNSNIHGNRSELVESLAEFCAARHSPCTCQSTRRRCRRCRRRCRCRQNADVELEKTASELARFWSRASRIGRSAQQKQQAIRRRNATQRVHPTSLAGTAQQHTLSSLHHKPPRPSHPAGKINIFPPPTFRAASPTGSSPDSLCEEFATRVRKRRATRP